MQWRVLDYPGDPPALVWLLTAQEFLDYVRQGQPGEIRITADDGTPPTVIPVEEIICDSCNMELPTDSLQVCALMQDRLYCPDCKAKWIDPYLREVHT